MSIESFFPYRLAVAAASVSRELEDLYRVEGGLLREEWRVLFLLAGEESLTSKEVAVRSSLDKVQISRAAQRLERKGLISGQVSQADRRLREYRCTDQGRAHFEALFPQVEARAADLLGDLSTEDRKALEQGVDALIRSAKGRANEPPSGG